jgi:hypothetical protein
VRECVEQGRAVADAGQLPQCAEDTRWRGLEVTAVERDHTRPRVGSKPPKLTQQDGLAHPTAAMDEQERHPVVGRIRLQCSAEDGEFCVSTHEVSVV